MKHISVMSLICGAVLFLSSCDWEQDVAPVPTFDGVATMTIAELLECHTIESADSYDTIPAGTIISGIVVSSDEHGNCYKYINIEDGTAGIQIKIDNSTLYHNYPVGQRIFVKCDGLVLGDYRKLPQLGMWENGAMQGIPSAKTSKYLFCDGAPIDMENEFTPLVLNSIPDADNIPTTYYNRLVKLEGATFIEGGAATYCEPNAATSHDIRMSDGSVITMRTSNYADFISEMLPTGTGTVYGILTRYNNYVQIVIRSLDDVQGFVAPQQTQTIFSVNYPTAFEDGWIHGDNWSIMNNSSFSGFFYNGSSADGSWLISPSIDLSNVTDPTFSFSHRAPQGFDATKMMCYYTANYTGDASTTLWIPFTLNAANGANTFVNESFLLPEGAQTQNCRIAFKVMGNNVQWAINNITITGLAK
ncbi:MAG: DUF5689 domain-containing protein [Bacteroidales bacterium]|nr:DUF5689 domain-containing protein [Bacteroidales bacterium]